MTHRDLELWVGGVVSTGGLVSLETTPARRTGMRDGLDRLEAGDSRVHGSTFGRPRKVDDAEHIRTAKRMKLDEHTGKAISRYLGVSRATL